MDVTEYDFFHAQLRQPNGQLVDLNGRKFIVNRELGAGGRMLSFVYPLTEAPLGQESGEQLDPAAHALLCEAIVFWDEVQALPGRQAKLLAT
jgi:hypothetical protein